MRAAVICLIVAFGCAPYGISQAKRTEVLSSYESKLAESGDTQRLTDFRAGVLRIGTTTDADFQMVMLAHGYEIKRTYSSVSSNGKSETFRIRVPNETTDEAFYSSLYGTHFHFDDGVLTGWTKSGG